MPNNITPVMDSDLVSTPVTTAPGAADPMRPHGGPVMPSVNVVALFAGEMPYDRSQMEAFMADFLEGGALDPLQAIGVSGGRLAAVADFPPFAAGEYTTDQLGQAILRFVRSRTDLPQPSDSTLYTLLLPDGVVVNYQGETTCPNPAFCGIHLSDASQHFIYSLQPAMTCVNCGSQGPGVFPSSCMVWNHEVVEAASDPYGTGYFSDGPKTPGSENADEYAWQPMSYGPWTVQGWADTSGNRVLGPYRGRPQPQPEPAPDPNTLPDLARFKSVFMPLVDFAEGLLGADALFEIALGKDRASEYRDTFAVGAMEIVDRIEQELRRYYGDAYTATLENWRARLRQEGYVA